MENQKRSFFAVLSLLLILLICFNGASIFSINIPENVAGNSRNMVSVSLSLSNFMYSLEEQNPSVVSKTHLESLEIPVTGALNPAKLTDVQLSMHNVQLRKAHQDEILNTVLDTHLPLLRKSHSLEVETDDLNGFPGKKGEVSKALTFMETFDRHKKGEFRAKVKEFFSKNESSCKVRFFMTWISSLSSFSLKEFSTIETLFSTHPNGCLLIVSNSMDSAKGLEILKPFSDKGFRVKAISPDLNYLFKNTMAESWYMKLIKGDINVGYVPLGQNLSNLLRLCLLYKFGGVYIDTDVFVLKSFSKLRNSIGAQTLDLGTKNWSRLNNAVMVFDKMHPLVCKFIEEYALTFNGNKWGHNGPYLVSRVALRLQGRPGYNFTVLPPIAFYPVNWDKVRVLFRGARNDTETKWLHMKYEQMRNQSYTVHFWNKQSRGYRIEDGSIIQKLFSVQCVFCNRTSTHDDTVSTME